MSPLPRISTSDLTALPDESGFRRLTQSLAVLDATLSPEWQYRYYSFDSNWADNVMMASMRNGSGDSWSAVITQAGVGLAQSYYSKQLNLADVQAIYDHKSLNVDLVKRLNADVDLDAVLQEANDIGYQ